MSVYKQNHFECFWRLWDFSPANDLQTRPQMEQKWGVSERIDGWVEHTLVPDLVTFIFSMRFTSKSLIPFRTLALHLFLSNAKSSKLLKGILVAEMLYSSLSQYRSQGRPVFLFPSFSSLCIRIFGIHLSLILTTWPAYLCWDCMKNVSVLLIPHLMKRLTFCPLSLSVYPHMERRQCLWKTSNSLICNRYGVHVSDPYKRMERMTAL